MSILINGVKMPKNCARCFVGDRTICRDECPIDEIPPHGRLIDADALTDNWYYASAALRPDDVKKVVCLNDIDNAPTIIEAEE